MNEKNKCKVLLIEDNPDHALIAKMSLKKLNQISEIDLVMDGQKALNYFFYDQASATKLPNITILDLNLPHVDGFKVLEQIRNDKHINKLPVVVLTTSQAESNINKAKELGVLEYFVKPLDINKLSEVIDSLWYADKRKNRVDPKIIPICSHCKRIRDDNGLWKSFDQKFSKDNAIDFSHSICPECRKKFYKNIL